VESYGFDALMRRRLQGRQCRIQEGGAAGVAEALRSGITYVMRTVQRQCCVRVLATLFVCLSGGRLLRSTRIPELCRQVPLVVTSRSVSLLDSRTRQRLQFTCKE
jgi:hypothetical protein